MVSKVDCVLALSRADATPITIVEVMMFKKLCACSDAVGISKYIDSYVNGFVFLTESIDALTELLIYIIDNYGTMDNINFYL